MTRCPNCGSEDAIEIAIDLSADDSVQFFQCRNCESKWWVRDGSAIDLNEVLDLTIESESKKR